ncbi:MAG: sugar phosphate isomerase/epimerase, partial [Phycisphaerae bacterium]|nr:sugar phosphate isomerase/epimerase [Phycisphaerae bacterium]
MKKSSIQHRIALVMAMVPLVSACFPGASQGAEPVNALACRLANYRQFQDTAWAHLPAIGFKYVFIDVPSPDQVETTKRKLARHGLTAVVLHGNTDLARPSSVNELAVQLETCEKMGVTYMFLSPKHTGVPKEVAYERLRRAGDIARKHGVTICLETHPDLGTNGDTHLETMKQINHPNVRVNFDTGNITYYNENTDAPTELKKIIDYVATVELKEHNGQYRTWNFPTFGKGVVNIASVLRILEEHNYRGPITIEIEGIQGIPWDEAQTKKAIADSAAYVRSLGRFDRLTARTYNSGFELAHDTYNGMSTGSDGRIYYVLSSESFKIGAQMYSYDPATNKIRHLGDLTEACCEKGLKTIAQGKSHVNFVESDGKLYFATHVGYYTIVDGMEKIGVPPAGYKAYPGGHFLAYDMTTGKFEDLAKAPNGEGILSMTMDTRRGRLYGLTWPTGYFIRYDLAGKNLKNLGPKSRQGENGKGENYRTLCRSLVVNPQDGSVYLTTGDGAILRYKYDSDSIEVVEGEDMKKDYFGLYDPTSAGHMGYNWRQTIWYEPERAVYGVHGNSGYLFRFEPQTPRVEVLDRITSLPSKRSGMYDQFSYGYLGFTLGPDGRTLHYLTGGPVYIGGKRVAGKSETAMGESKGIENLHLITYDIPTRQYTDQGPIFFENGQRPAYVNSIA